MTINNKKANAARVRQRVEFISQIAANDDEEPTKAILRATAQSKRPRRARVGITLAPISAMIGPFEKAGERSGAFREAKLALLRVQAHQTMETDASARKVEEALVPFTEAKDTITPGS